MNKEAEEQNCIKLLKSLFKKYYGEIMQSMYGIGLQSTFQEIFGNDMPLMDLKRLYF